MSYVVHEADVPPRTAVGDTAETRVTIDAGSGSPRLEQRVIRYAAGRSFPRAVKGRQEILFVVSGRGELVVAGSVHRLEPGTGALVVPGETYEIESAGPDPLLCVTVAVAVSGGAGPELVRTVRFDEQEELRADEDRTFRCLVDSGATQFVGIVRPCRAPDHGHPYDEVGYIIGGSGFAHVHGESIPIGPGSCFHLLPEEVHCIENAGPGSMRILGVFHPSGSPRQRS